MGSLSSRPKVKSSPQVVYVPASAAPVSQPSVPSAPVTPLTPPADKAASPDRAEGLLLRDRGRFGTVLTGFRGLLSLTQNAQPRKNLLGE
jgi:hypothetical protein